MSAYAIAVEGLEGLEDLEGLPERINRAARMAINRVLDTTRAESARKIRQQVNLPARYLQGSASRLTIAKKARTSDLEGIIRGRERPTSLARFVSGSTRPGKAGVRVEVKPGASSELKNAFLIRLPQGNTLTDTQYNLGLAIRLRDGERIRNKKHMVRLSRGLVLLYGPSVNQVFRDVAEQEAEPAAEKLEREFLRLLAL